MRGRGKAPGPAICSLHAYQPGFMHVCIPARSRRETTRLPTGRRDCLHAFLQSFMHAILPAFSSVKELDNLGRRPHKPASILASFHSCIRAPSQRRFGARGPPSRLVRSDCLKQCLPPFIPASASIPSRQRASPHAIMHECNCSKPSPKAMHMVTIRRTLAGPRGRRGPSLHPYRLAYFHA